MKISIFGLGYVGCVSAGCLSSLGHKVIGVDVSESKVSLINSGKPTIIEDSVGKLISDAVKDNKLTATTDYLSAVKNSDISFVCVGTPSSDTGHLNMEFIYKVAEQIGEALKSKDSFHTVVIRSTVLPGTNRKTGEVISAVSGKKVNIDFCVISNPEFLREGNAVYDFFNPPLTVIASDSEKGLNEISALYGVIGGDLVISGIPEAEMLKFVNNSFHALKVTFANEVGDLSKKLGVDSLKLMELFVKDRKLNISDAYLKPGYAFGGSCLPKDLKALKTMAHDNYVTLPVISNIEYSNSVHKNLLFDLISQKKLKKIGIVGISFKQGTDDLRESPIIDVIEKLLGKGYQIMIFDKNVSLSNLIGANREFIINRLPHISNLLTDDLEMLIKNSDAIVLNSKPDSIVKILKSGYEPKVIIDLVHVPEISDLEGYEGYCW